MKRPTHRTRILFALPMASLLAGCAAESVELFFAKPSGPDYLNCTQIAAATRKAAIQEQELKMLIDRAEQDAFGTLIAATSYKSDYLRLRGEQRLLAEAAQNKKCPPEPPAAPASSEPAPTRR